MSMTVGAYRGAGLKVGKSRQGAGLGWSGEMALRRILPEAAGTVVEIGAGKRAAISYYDAGKVERLIGVGSAVPRGMGEAAFPVEVLADRADRLSLPAASADTIVSTHALCTVPSIEAVLREIRRVLKPMGRLLFLEHGRADGRRMANWQDRLDPLWASVTGGCHINRNISRLVENAGFRLEYFDTFRLMPLPGIVGHHCVGIAQLR